MKTCCTILTVLVQFALAQEPTASSLWLKLQNTVLESDSCLQTHAIRFKQSYQWEIFFPVPKELKGARVLTIEKGQASSQWISRSAPAWFKEPEEIVLRRIADISLKVYLPQDTNGIKVSFSPIGPLVANENKLYYVLECQDINAKSGIVSERTFWLDAQSFEPVKIDHYDQGQGRMGELSTRIRAVITKLDSCSCFLPVTIELISFVKMRRDELPRSQSKLQVTNSDFELLPIASKK